MSYDAYEFNEFFLNGLSSPKQPSVASPQYSQGSGGSSKGGAPRGRMETAGSGYSVLASGYTLPGVMSPGAGPPAEPKTINSPLNGNYGFGFSEYGDFFGMPTSNATSTVGYGRARGSAPAEDENQNWAFGINQCSPKSFCEPKASRSLPVVSPTATRTSTSTPTTTSKSNGQQTQAARTFPQPSRPAVKPVSAPTIPARQPSRPSQQPDARHAVSTQDIAPTRDNPIDTFADFHKQQQPSTPLSSPKRDGRGGVKGVPSFRTWQMKRQAEEEPSTSNNVKRYDTVTRRKKRSDKRDSRSRDVAEASLDMTDAPAQVSPVPPNWLAAAAAASARKKSDESAEDGEGRRGGRPRVSISLSGKELEIQAPLTSCQTSMVKAKRNSTRAPPVSTEEPVMRTRGRTSMDGANELHSSLMPQNRLVNGRLSLSSGTQRPDESFRGPMSTTKDPMQSSMMPSQRNAFLNQPQRGVMSSLVAHGRRDAGVLDSQDTTGMVSLIHNDSRASLTGMQDSVDGPLTPFRDASHHAKTFSSDDEDGDPMGHSARMPSMWRRRSTTTRSRMNASARSVSRRARLQRTDSHSWLTGLEASVTTMGPSKTTSFSYMKRAPTAEDSSDDDHYDSDGDSENMEDVLSIHSSDEEDMSDSYDEDEATESDDDLGEASALAPDRQASLRIPRPRSQRAQAPQLRDWAPSHRVPQPQPNLPFNVGRGGCISINPNARTPQPSVGYLLRFNLDTAARRVPSPDWNRMGSTSPGTLPPMMQMNPMFAAQAMAGRRM